MKIESMGLIDYKPIKNLSLSKLGSMVVIAGANGSGKSRLKLAIVQTLQGSPQMDMTIIATRDEEREAKYFNGDKIEIKRGVQNPILTNGALKNQVQHFSEKMLHGKNIQAVEY